MFCEANNVPHGGYDVLTEDEFVKSMPDAPTLGQELAENMLVLPELLEAGNAGEYGWIYPADVSKANEANSLANTDCT